MRPQGAKCGLHRSEDTASNTGASPCGGLARVPLPSRESVETKARTTSYYWQVVVLTRVLESRFSDKNRTKHSSSSGSWRRPSEDRVAPPRIAETFFLFKKISPETCPQATLSSVTETHLSALFPGYFDVAGSHYDFKLGHFQ